MAEGTERSTAKTRHQGRWNTISFKLSARLCPSGANSPSGRAVGGLSERNQGRPRRGGGRTLNASDHVALISRRGCDACTAGGAVLRAGQSPCGFVCGG